MPESKDARLTSLLTWMQDDLGLDVGTVQPASADASFRRYFRVSIGSETRIVMDAPPDREDCEPFLRVGGFLREMGLNSPEIIATDETQGFLLLGDLGSLQYLDALRQTPARADALYGDAINALLVLHERGGDYLSQLPRYDVKLLQTELALFRDWLCGTHLSLEFSAADERDWQECRDFLIESALAQPRVFVHRDYHSRNLMVCSDNNPGILDFQDAVSGPLTYDLVSLLRDCYLRWPGVDTRRRALQFFAASRERLPFGFDEAVFVRAFDLMGVQRHLKAAGIFARLNHRDGKPGYLADVPRTLGYVTDVAGRYSSLKFLHRLVRDRCIPALESLQ